MINYQSEKASPPFLMLPRTMDDDLSPDAYYLFIKLMKLAPDESNDNKSLREKTNFSKGRYDKAKAELVHKGYLDTKQLRANYYAFYIGKQSAKRYKEHYKKSENRHGINKIKQIKQSLDGNKTEPPKSR